MKIPRSRRTPAQLLREGTRLLDGLQANPRDIDAARASVARITEIVVDVASADLSADPASALAHLRLSAFAFGYATAERGR